METNIINEGKDIDLEKFIVGRRNEMIGNKNLFTNEIELSDLQRESYSEITHNGNIFNYPIEKAIIGLLESELGDNDIVYKLNAIGDLKDVNKIKPNEFVLDYLYNKDKTSEKAKGLRKNFLKYGIGIMFEGLDIKHTKIRGTNSSFNGEFLKNNNEEYSKVTDNYEFLLGSRVVHPSNFFIDNNCINIENANDFFEREILSAESIKNKFKGKNFINFQYVIESLTDKDNEVWHYFNIPEDIYGILINNNLVYRGPNPYPHKLSPFSIAVLSKSDKHPYGEGGIPKLIRFAKGTLNEVFNITINQSKNANMPPILMGAGVDFDDSEPEFGIGNIWKFSGSLSEVREMKMSSPDASIFNIINIIFDLIVQLLGVDPRALYSKSSKTKFEAGLIEQTKNKRISVMGKTLDYCYEDMLNKRLKNAHYFIDVIALEKILDPNLSKLKKAGYKKIILKDKEITKLENGDYTVENVPGAYGEFELKPEEIRGDINVSVITESTRPILKEIAKDDILSILKEVREFAALDPTILQTINFKDLMKLLLNSYGRDIDELIPDTKSKQIEEKINKIKEAMIKIATENNNENVQGTNLNNV